MRTASRLLAFAAINCACLAALAADPLDAEDRKLFADGLFSRGLNDRAAVEYGALVAEYPQMNDIDVVMFRWGESLRLSGNDTGAFSAYSRLINGFPQSAYRHRAMFQRGALALTSGQYPMASELMGKLIAENPEAKLREPAMYFMGDALRETGTKTNEAIAAYEALIREYPQGEHASYAKLALGGMLLARKGDGDLDRGLALLRDASKNPQSPRIGAEALYLTARTEFARDNFKASSDAYDELFKKYPADERTSGAMLSSCWAAFRSGRYAEVISRAKSRTPGKNEDEWLYLKGASEFETSAFADAIASFARLVKSHPDSKYAPAAHYQMANAYRKTGENAKAVEAAENVPGKDSLRKNALWLMGECSEAMKDDKRAIQYYKMLAQEFPDESIAPAALYRVAAHLSESSSWVAAADTYRGIVAKYPGSDAAMPSRFASGYCLMKAGRGADAIQDWNELLKLEGGGERAANALFYKALEELRLGRDTDAIASLDRLLSMGSVGGHRAEGLYWRAQAYYGRKDCKAAESDLNAALGASPSQELVNEIGLLRYFVVREIGGRDKEAAESLQPLIGTSAGKRITPQMLGWLSNCQRELGEFAKAEQAAEALAKIAPDDEWRQAAWTLAGRAAAARKDDDAAKRAFGNAIAVHGETRYVAEARLRLGELLLASGDFAAAEPHFAKAAEIAAKSKDLQSVRIMSHIGIGRARAKAGDKEGASRYLLSVCLLYKDDALIPPLIEETVPMLRELGRDREADALVDDISSLYPESDSARRMADEIAARAMAAAGQTEGTDAQ